MSEQIFTGLAPTAPEGRELFLHSLDAWIALHEAIQRLVVEDFPFCPTMTPESAANLADLLTGAVADGTAKLAIADAVAPYFEDECADEDDERSPAERRADYADYLFELLEQFIAFLKACGGCTSQ